MARKRKTTKPDLPPGAQPPLASSAPSSGHTGRASPVPPPRQPAAATAHDNAPQTQTLNLPTARTQQPAASDSRNLEPQIQPFPAPRAQQPQQPSRPPASTARNAGATGQSDPASLSRQPQQPAAQSAQKPGPQAQSPQVSLRQKPAKSSAGSSEPPTQSPPSGPPMESATSSAQDSRPEIIPPVFCCASIQPTTPFTTPKATKDCSAEFQKSLEKYHQDSEDQLQETPNPYTAKQIQTIKGNLVYCKWDLVHSKQALEHHLETHPDHEPDFQHFLTWASTSSLPQKSRPAYPSYKHVIQVTQDLRYNPTAPQLRNLTLRSRLYAPLPGNTGYCELPCGRDNRTPQPKKIQIGNTLVCDEHKTRFFVCLYARNPPGEFGGRDDRAVIQFEGGAGVHDGDVGVWFGRTGWGKGGLEGSSFREVGGINCVRAGVGRGLGVQG